MSNILNFPKPLDDHLVIDGGKTKDAEIFHVEYNWQGASIIIWSGPSYSDALACAREVSITDRVRILDMIGGAR